MNNYLLLPSVTHHYVVFICQTFFDIFQNLGADGKGLADKVQTVKDSADVICIVT